jgi:predicted metalloprotease
MSPEPLIHGTAEQRQRWFKTGLESETSGAS